MGAELIYQARSIVLLAAGKRKAASVAEALSRDSTDAVPISYGQDYVRRGGGLTYVLDREAAAGVFAERSVIERLGAVIQDISDGSADKKLADLVFFRDPETGRMG
jgi:glucosamine-6-phosphate deaminase